MEKNKRRAPISPQTCPQCGFNNPEGFNFCGKCGSSLSLPQDLPENIAIGDRSKIQLEAAQQPKPTAGIESSKAERRQITVMFCDLVGSTDLSMQLDPEDFRELVRDYQTAGEKAIVAFEGHIAQYLGDGLLVYFGFPAAHENDAQHAVLSALGIVAEIQRLNERLHAQGLQIAVRIGIHTGLVVVGEMGGKTRLEHLALGQTPNIAARLQGLAQPNAILLSGMTHKLIQGHFETQALGCHTLKGVTPPIEVYQVLRTDPAHRRFEKHALRNFTPIIGRETELAQMAARWQRVKNGTGQVLLISGEAGVGKSRLLEAFMAQACEDQHAALTCRCSPYETNRALYPVFDALERFFETRREGPHEQKLHGLQKELERYGLAAAETQILMANLLPVSQDSLDNLSYGSTQLQRQKTHRVILKLLQAISTQKPLLLTVEDLHWADAATLELLDLLVAETTNSPIMACFTFRPKYLAPWEGGAHLTRIALQPLPPKEIAAMIDALAGKALPREMLRQLVVKTDGVPLFIEELTKMVLESGLLIEHKNHFEMAGPLPALAIPTSLHDSLMARLDRMATVKDVAQLGATIGREFSYELIHLVSQLDHQTLKNELGRLVEAGLLYKDGAPANEKYVFKHALIRDTAYETLLKSTRQLYHVRIAQVLVEYFPRLIEARPELVAYHYTEAHSSERAAPFWLHAGQRASRRWAPDEAMVYFNKGLALMKEMPESPEGAQLELECLIALGSVLVVTKGYAAAEVELTYARARELAMQLGDHPHLYPAVLGLAIYYLIRGEFQAARELAEQALKLATTVQDPAVLVESHYVLGTTLFHLGYLTQARLNLEQGLALYETRQHRSMISRFGHDSGVFCLCYLARILWFQGYPDQAERRSVEAMVLARELGHPFSLALALTFAALVSQLRLEIQVTRALAEEAIALCTEHGFTFCMAMATVLHGWALTELDQKEIGITQIEKGLEAWRATGAELFRPHLLALLAESYGKADRMDEGWQVLTEALTAAHKSGKRFYTAELYRLKGILLMKLGNSTAEVEECFLQAITIARNQQARSLELRATAGLFSYQPDNRNARSMLQQAYDWFGEGFDTLDLQLAATLLTKH